MQGGGGGGGGGARKRSLAVGSNTREPDLRKISFGAKRWGRVQASRHSYLRRYGLEDLQLQVLPHDFSFDARSHWRRARVRHFVQERLQPAVVKPQIKDGRRIDVSGREASACGSASLTGLSSRSRAAGVRSLPSPGQQGQHPRGVASRVPCSRRPAPPASRASTHVASCGTPMRALKTCRSNATPCARSPSSNLRALRSSPRSASSDSGGAGHAGLTW